MIICRFYSILPLSIENLFTLSYAQIVYNLCITFLSILKKY